MKEKFKSLPEALQKQIIIQFGACALSLLLLLVVLVMYRDLYLCLSFVLFSLFFGISGVLLLLRAVDGKYVVIEGVCSKVERTALRKRPKTIYFKAELHTVKLQTRQRLKNISTGDTVVLYVSENTPVYEAEGCQILSAYLAMYVKKGAEPYGND